MSEKCLNNVVSAVKDFENYIKCNKNSLDESSMTILKRALLSARSIIRANKIYFNKKELKVLLDSGNIK